MFFTLLCCKNTGMVEVKGLTHRVIVCRIAHSFRRSYKYSPAEIFAILAAGAQANQKEFGHSVPELRLVMFESLVVVLVVGSCFEVSLARRQNHKLAWEDAWNHGKINL